MLTKPAGTTQVLTSSGSSAQSTALTDVTRVRLAATENVHVAFGTNPTAANTDMILTKDAPEVFAITPGHKVAVLQVTTGGKVSVTPVR